MDNILKKLDDDLLVFGVSDILKEFHKNNKENIVTLLKNKIHISTYYYWLNGKSPIPIKYLRLFSRLDNDILDNCYNKITFISAGKKKCILPRKSNDDLSYIIGVLHGDGHVHKNKKFVTVTVDSKDYIKNTLLPLFKKLFDTNGHIFEFDNYYRLEIGSRVVHSYISLFCPVGKKVGRLKIPEEIKKNKKFLASYLSGLFDTDGCVGYTRDKKQFYFVFLQRDKEFVYEVYCALKNL